MAEHEHLRAFVAVDRTTEPKVSYHDGEVAVPITATTCYLWLDGDREPRSEPDMENPIGPVRFESHVLPLAEGDVVRVMKIGATPRIVGRLA